MITLGINYSQMHDSSACIVRDGELLFAVAEERLSRVKHDARFPELAIRACLEFAGVRAEQLDEVCFGWQTAGPVYRHDLNLDALRQWPRAYPKSLGLFYGAFTEYLGLQPNSDEWKVMGLARYGDPGVKLDAFIDAAAAPYRVFAKRLRSDGNASSTLSLLGAPRKPESDIDARHKNLAYAVQDACEKAMMNVVRVAIEKTRCRNLCLAGGVALNSKANGKILASQLMEKMFVQPAASDDGVALGAALAPYLDHGGRVANHGMRRRYLRPALCY